MNTFNIDGIPKNTKIREKNIVYNKIKGKKKLTLVDSKLLTMTYINF